MNVFEIAEYLFGPMRSSTNEENKLVRDIMDRTSEPVGVNIFDMYENDEDSRIVEDKEN